MTLPKHVTATPGNQLSLEKAATLSGLSEKKLQSLIDEGLLPAVKSQEGVRVEQRDVETLSALEGNEA